MSVGGVINGFTLGGVSAITDGNGATLSVTSGAEVILATYSITGGQFKADDILKVQLIATWPLSSSTTMVLYWSLNPSPAAPYNTTSIKLAGASTGNLYNYLSIMRHIAIVSDTTSLVYPTNVSNTTDFGDAAGNELNASISTITGVDWSKDGYFIVTQSDNGTAGGLRNFIEYYFTVIV
jgi:hypothetical protein